MASTPIAGTATLGAVPLRQDAQIIGLVSVAHLISHFSQLLLPPLFPWLKEALGASYTELGFLMTVFFGVSCAVQAASGFWVDKYGPRPVLFMGLGLIGVAALGFSLVNSYGGLLVFVVLAGVGNGVFHPVDYTLINKKVSAPRLGHAYSTHGLSGSLGWALAPAVLVPITMASSYRVALQVASAMAFAVLVLLWFKRKELVMPSDPPRQATEFVAKSQNFAFLRIPAVWACFGFFLLFAIVISVIQAFAPEAARHLHGLPVGMAAACLTIYMVCSAGGMVLGGFLASDPARCERVVGIAFACAAALSLVLGLAPLPSLAVPVLFAMMGFAAGTAGPSRDLLVKKTTPDNATGRVYGVVYAGLDIGQATAPLLFGPLMDRGQFVGVFIGLAMVQLLLIGGAFNVRKARRT
ncbi:MAG TPA: MFS transporter [Burkholderiaceae bacterium]|nr:MFS transporter [Burkholderiaceae bacterium]